MKRVFRLSIVQSALGFILSTYIAATLATMRWRFENREPVDAAAGQAPGGIGCFWHGRIALAVACGPVLRGKPRRVLISLSADGDFIAKAVERLGFPAIRGSAGHGAERLRKGGAPAFMEAVRFVEAGGVVVVTPDGPRGPRETMPVGPVLMAKASGCQVFLFGLAAHPAFTLKSWDRTCIPRPFSRGCVVFDGPLFVPADADQAQVEALRSEWQTRLCAAQARAEAIATGAVTPS